MLMQLLRRLCWKLKPNFSDPAELTQPRWRRHCLPKSRPWLSGSTGSEAGLLTAVDTNNIYRCEDHIKFKRYLTLAFDTSNIYSCKDHIKCKLRPDACFWYIWVGVAQSVELLVRRSQVQFPLWPPASYWLGRCQYNVTGWDRSHGPSALPCVWQHVKLSEVSLGTHQAI